jgi:type IV secretory pathway VirB10-like protein
MTGDPYEEADEQQRSAEAKLVTPTPAKKSRKIVFAGMILAGTILAVVILANIAGLVTGKVTPDAHPAPKPTTMTHQQSDSFAQQQSGQAAYMKGMDRDKTLQNNEDTVLGQSGDLAADAYAEAAGVPKKTKAQDDAEHVRPGSNRSGAKSEAQQQRERAALEEQHRRQNDLDSSSVALDFSDYFEKERQPARSSVAANQEATQAPNSEDAAPDGSAQRRHVAFADVLGSDGEQAEMETASSKRRPHDPKGDYAFDSSFGKLYRLMEDTVIETVLANRLTGAAVGPVITMVTTDVYSGSGSRLLIPKGTRLLGSVSAVGSVNQERLFVAFHRMIMPDGYSVSLDKFQGLDVVGQTGLRDQVNHHYVQIFGASLALAAISATAQIGNNSSYGTYDWGTQMRNGVSEGLGQSAQRVMERFLNVLPTFTIRERARVKVMLAGDLLLPDIKNHTMDPDL